MKPVFQAAALGLMAFAMLIFWPLKTDEVGP